MTAVKKKNAPRTSAAAETTKLSRDDWLDAAFQAVVEGGFDQVRVLVLAHTLGVTRGSFYWHFADIAGYRAALIEAWAEQRGAELAVHREVVDLAPRERLSRLMAAVVSPQHWRLERAMREWARTDESVAAGVGAADRRVLRTVRQAFVDLGFDPDEADLRARTTFAAGIGFLQLTGSKPDPLGDRQRERFLEFMVRP